MNQRCKNLSNKLFKYADTKKGFMIIFYKYRHKFLCTDQLLIDKNLKKNSLLHVQRIRLDIK